MNAKSVIALVLVAVIAVIGAFWVTSERSPETETSLNQALIPGLKGTVNDVTAVQLVKAGEEPVATLNRGEHGWTVAEKHDYPADIGKVRDLLLNLADAEILEEKTANPELYDRLGVQDITKTDASGVEISLQGLAKPIAVIVGDYAPQAGGTYVRRANEAQSWLVSGNPAPAKDTQQWLDPVIVDLPAERIQSITVRHPDGETLTVAKETRDQTSFTVQDIPPGRELKSEGVANSPGGALTGLRLEDVQPASALDPAAQEAIDLEYRTFDGLIFKTQAFATENAKHLHFTIAFDEDQAQRFAPDDEGAEDAAVAEEAAETATESPGLDDPELAALREEAEKLNTQLSLWVYTVPDYKYEILNKRMEDMLKPAETEVDEPAALEEGTTE